MSVSGSTGGGSGIRRHHTISITPGRAAGSSRTGVISEEPQEISGSTDWPEDDDDYVAEDWTAPTIGSVGDGSKGLHRQASLPNAYHNREVHRVRSAAHMATRVNSLSAIEAEHIGEDEADEEEWEKHIPWNRDGSPEAQHAGSPEQNRPNLTRTHTSSSVSSVNGPISPIYGQSQVQSPPPQGSSSGGANVRRHQSLTYGPGAGGASKLSRTLTASGANKRGPAHHAAPGVLALGVPPPPPRETSPITHEEDNEGSVPSSPVTRAVGWGDPRGPQQQYSSGVPSSGNDWRESTLDDVQRALGALEMQTSNSNQSVGAGRPTIGRPLGSPSTTTPPRYLQSPNQAGPARAAQQQHSSYFAPAPAPPPSSYTQSINQRASGGGSSGYNRRASSPGIAPGSGGGISHVDRRDSVNSGGSGYTSPGIPPSRSNSMPAWDIPTSVGRPRGDSTASGTSVGGYSSGNNNSAVGQANNNSYSANPNTNSNPNAAFASYSGLYGNPNSSMGGGGYDPNMNASTAAAILMPGSPYSGMMNLNINTGLDMYGANTGPYGGAYGGMSPQQQQQQTPQQHMQNLATPRAAPVQMTPMASSNPLPGGGVPMPPPSTIDSAEVQSLIATKGYNPQTIDIQPKNARFFVIKSYTEEDVHKSLKYEIWSSTDPGNKRLDKAFRENGGRGPIYLFFSVNTSGHFCGMAEMLTPLDYSRSSTVWTQDKWKGVFKVRWIFVRDIPNAILRGIKLENTQERKPVTNSRDTQELLPDAGSEMMRIFITHEAKTSLLQDYAYYDLLAMQKINASGSPTSDVPPQAQANPTGPPQRMIQQRQQQQQHQYQQQQHPQHQQGMPPLPPGPGNNGMFAVTAQQYQLLQQSQYALAAVRNIQEQLAQQQLQLQQQQQQQSPQSPPGIRRGMEGNGGQQFGQQPSVNVNIVPSGMPQPQPQSSPQHSQGPYLNRQGSGNGRPF